MNKQTLLFRLTFLAASAVMFVFYWLPFLRGEKHFLHDSLAHANLVGLFYDRLYSGDSWLWSAALNGGHPLWPSLEVAPIADPVAFFLFSAAAALQSGWLAPFHLTAIVWILVFAGGGALCAHFLTGNRWAALLAFVLLAAGPLALATPAQTSGFLVPFRYFPVMIYFYFRLREGVTLRDSFYLNAVTAFSLAGYQSVFSFILILALILSELLLDARGYLAWLSGFLHLRLLATFIIPLLALAPSLAWLVYTTDLVGIPRAYMSWHVYILDPLSFISDLFLPYMNAPFAEILWSTWGGSSFMGLLVLPLLLFGLRRSILGATTWRRGTAGIEAHLCAVAVVWLAITVFLACGLFGLDDLVRRDGAILGVRNFGFLLTGTQFLLVLLVAKGFAEIMAGLYSTKDIAVDSLIFAGLSLFAFWFPAPFETAPWPVVALVFLFMTFALLCLTLRNRFGGLVFAFTASGMILAEVLWFGGTAIYSFERLAAPPDREALHLLVKARQPEYRQRHETLPDFRAYAFPATAHWPFHLEGAAIYRTSSALSEPVYLKRIGNRLMRRGLTQTHLFRLRRYDELLRDEEESLFVKEVLGVTRPVLELVPRDAVRTMSGPHWLVMNPEPGAAKPDVSSPLAGEILARDYEGDRLTVTLRANGPGVLVYRDNFARGWRVRLDGEPAELMIVDRLNKAVEVPAGEHLVEFRYRPWAYLIGFALRAGVLIVVGLVCLRLVLRRWQESRVPSSQDRLRRSLQR